MRAIARLRNLSRATSDHPGRPLSSWQPKFRKGRIFLIFALSQSRGFKLCRHQSGLSAGSGDVGRPAPSAGSLCARTLILLWSLTLPTREASSIGFVRGVYVVLWTNSWTNILDESPLLHLLSIRTWPTGVARSAVAEAPRDRGCDSRETWPATRSDAASLNNIAACDPELPATWGGPVGRRRKGEEPTP